MTDLLSRPSPTTTEKLQRSGPPLVGYGLIVAGWTAALGLAICIAVAVVGWFASDSGAFSEAVRIGALSWIVGNGGGLHASGVAITLMPLGPVGLIGWTLYRGGRWVGSRSDHPSWTDLAGGTLAIAAGYCGVALVVSALTRSSEAHADLARTVASTFLLGLLFGGLGTLRGAGRGADLLVLLPVEVRAALHGGVGGVGVLIAASAGLVTASIVAHLSTAVTLAESLHAGLVGGGVVALLGLALLPNGVLWAGAFLAGPGFAVGSGSMVAPGQVSTGPLPAFPLLAAVPRSPGSAVWEIAVLLAPLAAGGIAGLLAVRRYPVTGLDSAALRGALAGLGTGLGFGLLTGLSGGAVGPGRMQDFGPILLPTVVACGAACLLGGAVTAVGGRWLATGRRPPTLGRRDLGSAERPEQHAQPEQHEQPEQPEQPELPERPRLTGASDAR